ncbi:hypothetical protein M378DRAFT_171228 [Amanita muscaria Koide BX008]|uniref:F-box domain-containing protein n=1 Tax=Amanita muscaria (strain Koide BX008) TaxID=946122 RepID=A0A0C2SV23_AMAMK|nr:hypothetical protein M378DRAFT_171228 [Amanita muscaria Koide BX008]
MQHEHVGSYMVYLPMELHVHIRHKLITDPETTISQLRSLRLVCKLFDTLWSPMVMHNMTLFTGDPIHHVNRLFDIVRDKGTTAAFTTTLTLRNWEFLEFRWSFWKLRNPWHYLSLDTLRHFKETLYCVQARRYASLLPDKLQLPYLRCVRLFFPRSESNWATYHLTRMLTAFSQLTELELTIAVNVDMAYVAQCLRHLQGLRKLKLVILYVRRLGYLPQPEINRFSRFIADNHNITHLTLRPCTRNFNLSELFLDVPSNRPLILEHVSCNDNCQNFEGLLPHIQSLSSFEFQCDRSNTWCTTLSDAGIFPPTIKAYSLDPQITIYLMKHPGIVGLSIYEEGGTMSAIEGDQLCSILAQHSATLHYLKITSPNLTLMLRTLQNELNFKQCKNLREIVLNGRYGAFYSPLTRALWESDKSYHEKQIFPVLAHLNCSLTVVLKYVQVAIFDACVEFCGKSDDSFVCNLAGRLVLEPWAT